MVQDLARSRATDLIPQEVLVHVPGYAAGGTTARAARLYGGTVNASFRVDTSAGRFVVRIHDAAARDARRGSRARGAAACRRGGGRVWRRRWSTSMPRIAS